MQLLKLYPIKHGRITFWKNRLKQQVWFQLLLGNSCSLNDRLWFSLNVLDFSYSGSLWPLYPALDLFLSRGSSVHLGEKAEWLCCWSEEDRFIKGVLNSCTIGNPCTMNTAWMTWGKSFVGRKTQPRQMMRFNFFILQPGASPSPISLISNVQVRNTLWGSWLLNCCVVHTVFQINLTRRT